MKVIKKEKKEQKVPTKKEPKIIEVNEAVRIPETNIILTKGDKFEILEQEEQEVKENKKSQTIKETGGNNQAVWNAIEELANSGGTIKELRSAVAGGIDIVWGDEAIDDFFKPY